MKRMASVVFMAVLMVIVFGGVSYGLDNPVTCEQIEKILIVVLAQSESDYAEYEVRKVLTSDGVKTFNAVSESNPKLANLILEIGGVESVSISKHKLGIKKSKAYAAEEIHSALCGLLGDYFKKKSVLLLRYEGRDLDAEVARIIRYPECR